MPETGEPQIVYTSRLDATYEGELPALADVYAFVLRCAQEKKNGDVPSTADDGKEIQNAPATARIPRQQPTYAADFVRPE